MSDKWLTIINPNAGNKKVESDWQNISALLDENGIEYTPVFTHFRLDAITQTKLKIEEGYNKILVVAGDGTLNEVVNGIFAQDRLLSSNITVAMIPSGTGNDWARTFNIPTDYKKAIEIIINNKTMKQDIGFVKYFEDKIQRLRYFINVSGAGFDANVAQKVNKDKEQKRSGILLYVKNLFQTLVSAKSINSKLIIDGKTFLHDIFSISVGIGKYNGGGMMQLPNAIPDDGLLDITLIKKISKFGVVTNVKNLFDGSFIKHPSIELFTGKSVEIVSEQKLFLEADGESLGHSPFTFGILPKALSIISGV